MKTSKILNITIVIAQILLSVSLIWASSMKLFQPADKLARMWPWTSDNRELVILTGIIDAVAAVGLILPDLMRSKTKLTVYAAYGIIVLMISASFFHIFRGEASQIGVNIVFLLIALFIIWGKHQKLKIFNSIDKID
ncbi:hypothetical protein CEY12_09025 [Chryseobacterium sp. T16E-39]|uniref:DoxX family protein n=1 Tax=Chryseobacterium sp. T16E-39 TaxID=2015076 RepID=UPI000B5B3241|nr:DoxX family protein [Chryseobacterium sp. T16E-39]ASK30247.1 hypothetical protein CEY12_09025 [Chryseobacterium sp. T16E-39]